MNVKKEVAALERRTVNDLRERCAEVYGESTNGRHEQWLVRPIVWRMSDVRRHRVSGVAQQTHSALSPALCGITIPKGQLDGSAFFCRMHEVFHRRLETVHCCQHVCPLSGSNALDRLPAVLCSVPIDLAAAERTPIGP